MEYIKANHPRLMFIGFDETDDYSHEGKYDRYLLTAHQSDKVIGELWNWLQSHDQYKDQTTLILTCDHGRGQSENDMWHSHGEKIKGSDQTWLAIIGPDTKAFGEINVPGQIYNNQVAMTIAQLLKIDYKNPKAGKAVLSAITK
jgi:phosphopentomutase